MRLIGNFLSPYVRRVAISLNTVGLPYELQSLFVFKEPDAVRAYNPVARIPTLVLDDNDVLVESYAILDEIDQMVGSEKALCPPHGAERRRVMKLTAIAVASMEKAQWAFYEPRFRPPEKVHQPWIDHNDQQVLGGFRYLDGVSRKLGARGWLAGTDHISQADITAAVAFAFAKIVRPNLDLSPQFPDLARFSERCEALEAFRAAPIPALPP